jgi:hypothetical protein
LVTALQDPVWKCSATIVQMVCLGVASCYRHLTNADAIVARSGHWCSCATCTSIRIVTDRSCDSDSQPSKTVWSQGACPSAPLQPSWINYPPLLAFNLFKPCSTFPIIRCLTSLCVPIIHFLTLSEILFFLVFLSESVAQRSRLFHPIIIDS